MATEPTERLKDFFALCQQKVESSPQPLQCELSYAPDHESFTLKNKNLSQPLPLLLNFSLSMRYHHNIYVSAFLEGETDANNITTLHVEPPEALAIIEGYLELPGNQEWLPSHLQRPNGLPDNRPNDDPPPKKSRHSLTHRLTQGLTDGILASLRFVTGTRFFHHKDPPPDTQLKS